MNYLQITQILLQKQMIYGGFFEVDYKIKRLEELSKIISSEDFWSDNDSKDDILKEEKLLKNIVEPIKNLKNQISSNLEIIELIQNEFDEELKTMVESDIDYIKEKIDTLELNTLLNGPYDSNNCILEIHPGAGGTESCDWANMLYRMYTRYAENNNFKIEVIDYQVQEEAGIKSVSFIVSGVNAYGMLKNEKGVHRLIRISPFDSNKRRHTSFASVDVTPIFLDNDVNIEINEQDIRIDVYRSSGKGGQGVNTTDSAVRITHIPSKIVVTCQNERSQIRNKETAMKVLKNKLYQLELEKKQKELMSIKGINSEINFGSQIRTYTMHPYSLVKDHRTNFEDSNVLKVLDGSIDRFIDANLRKCVGNEVI